MQICYSVDATISSSAHWSSSAPGDTACVTAVSLLRSQLHQASPHTNVTWARCPTDYKLEPTDTQSQHDSTARGMIPRLLAWADHLHSSNLQYNM